MFSDVLMAGLYLVVSDVVNLRDEFSIKRSQIYRYLGNDYVYEM